MLPLKTDSWTSASNILTNLQPPIENGDNLPPEVDDWVKSCFAHGDELPDNDDEWQALKSALLDTLPSQPVDLFAELGSSSNNLLINGTHDALNSQPSGSGNSWEALDIQYTNRSESSSNGDAEDHTSPGAHIANSSEDLTSVWQPTSADEDEDIDAEEELVKVSREQGKTKLKFRGKEYILLNYLDGEDQQSDEDAGALREENVDSLENIFRVWELEIPDEEDELTSQLKLSDTKLPFGLENKVDALAADLADLSLDPL